LTSAMAILYRERMSRPIQALSLVVLTAAGVFLSGCSDTVYRDVYSPRRNYWVPPPEEKKEIPSTVTNTSTPAPTVTPSIVPGGMPAVPPAPAAPPSGIPGL
jgi:hypothetical protein